ncbi:MAG: translation initiation factor [Planctomycetes bacterium]|nr:translation initiation factor [Planctomycetota bacterium]
MARGKQAPPSALRQSQPIENQRIVVRTEGRPGGKTVTIAQGFRLTDPDLKALAKTLKKTLSVGGKSADGKIELQGRLVERAVALLEAAGYQAQAR